MSELIHEEVIHLRNKLTRAEAELAKAKNPSREELVDLCRARAVRDDNGMSIVEAFHVATLRFERAEKDNTALRAALEDFAKFGVRHDLTPTHNLNNPEEFWHAYVQQINDHVKAQARTALAGTGGKEGV